MTQNESFQGNDIAVDETKVDQAEHPKQLSPEMLRLILPYGGTESFGDLPRAVDPSSASRIGRDLVP